MVTTETLDQYGEAYDENSRLLREHLRAKLANERRNAERRKLLEGLGALAVLEDSSFDREEDEAILMEAQLEREKRLTEYDVERARDEKQLSLLVAFDLPS